MKNQETLPLLLDRDLVAVSWFQWLDRNHFALLDKFVTHRVFIFHRSGRLVCELGRPGQGPGEYHAPTGVTLQGDRLFLSEVGGKLNIYQSKTCRFEEFYYLSGNAAIARGLYSLGENELLMPVFSRYAKYSLHVLDLQAKQKRAFSKRESIFSHAFDTLAPQGGVVVSGGQIYQFFNHRYEIRVFDFDGKLQRKLRLASGIYLAPDFERAKAAKSHKLEISLRGSFTQFVGLHRLGKGWVTVLRNWKDPRNHWDTLEFWDTQFAGQGRIAVPDDEFLLGTEEDKLMFFHVGETKSSIQFRYPDLPQTGFPE